MITKGHCKDKIDKRFKLPKIDPIDDKIRNLTFLADLFDTPETKKALARAAIDLTVYGKVTLSFENGKLTMINKSENIKPGGGK